MEYKNVVILYFLRHLLLRTIDLYQLFALFSIIFYLIAILIHLLYFSLQYQNYLCLILNFSIMSKTDFFETDFFNDFRPVRIDAKTEILAKLKTLSLSDFLSKVDFSNALPKVCNVSLRSNYDIYRVIMDLLSVAGYQFPVWDPVPAKLYNWRTIDRKVLVKYGARIVDQLRDGIDISKCVLDLDGFRFFYKPAHSVDPIVSGRVYTLDFDYDIKYASIHRSKRAFVPYENLKYTIDKFFERSELSNKVLLIK